MKKSRLFLKSIILVIIIGIATLIIKKIEPFGNNTIIMYDLRTQYIGFISYVRNALMNMDFSSFSFKLGIGNPVIVNIFSYLMSPINLILVVLNNKNLFKYISLFIFIFRSVLTSITMTYYLYKHYGIKWFIPVLSACYALCGYFIVYNINIMWMDAFTLLPLLTLGIEELIKHKKDTLFFITLLISFLSNYYIGYMIVIYSFMYFVIYIFLNYKNIDDLKTIIIKLFISMLKVFLISLFIIIPVKYAINLSRGMTSMSFDNIRAMSIFEFVSSFMTAKNLELQFITDSNNYMVAIPNFSVSIFVFLLSFISILNIKKDKKPYSILIIIYTIVMFIPFLDIIMHGGTYPLGFPYRYSFIFSFLLVAGSSSIINNYKDINKKHLIIVSLISFILMVFSYLNTKSIDKLFLIINLFLLFIYIFIYNNKNSIIKKTLIIILVCIELFLNCALNIRYNNNSILYDSYNDYENIKPIKSKDYRIVSSNKTGYNDGILYGYNGMDLFITLLSNNDFKFMSNIGLYNNGVDSYMSYGDNDFINLLFNVKYVLENNSVKENKVKGYVFKIDNYEDIIFDRNKPIDNLNKVAKNLFNVDNLYELVSDYNYKETDNRVDYIFNDDNILIEFTDSIDKVIINNKEIEIQYEMFNDVVGSKILNLKRYKSNKISIIYKNDIKDIVVYKLNYSKLDEIYNKIDYTPKLTFIRDDYIKIETDKDEDMLLYTSILYSDGWHIYIDGKEEKINQLFNSLIGINVSKGKHEILLKYETPYLKEGIIVSSLTIIVNSIYIVYRTIKKEEEYEIY